MYIYYMCMYFNVLPVHFLIDRQEIMKDTLKILVQNLNSIGYHLLSFFEIFYLCKMIFELDHASCPLILTISGKKQYKVCTFFVTN
jgi:hypothetical protein